MTPNLTDDEVALRRALGDAVSSPAAPSRSPGETLDRAVVQGRRRRAVRRSAGAVTALGAVGVVLVGAASMLPSTTSGTSPALGGPAGSSNATSLPTPTSSPSIVAASSPAPTPTSTTAPTPVPSSASAYGSSGVPNESWPSASWLESVATKVVAAGGGTVVSTTPGIDYYEPPVGYDAQRKPLWAQGSHLRSRTVELAVSTKAGYYLVDVTVQGNNPKGPGDVPNDSYFPPSFDMSVGTPGVSTLVSEKGRKVFAYANKAFPERKTLQAMVWRSDTLLLTVVVTNYGVETPGKKKPTGPSWSQLGLTPTDLLDAVG